MSNSLRPHGLQHAWLPCPSFSQSLFKLVSIESVMPSNHLILYNPLLLSPPLFPSIRVFSKSWLFPSGGQSIGTSASASTLPMNIKGWFPLGLAVLISLLCKDAQESPSTPQFRSINSLGLGLLGGPTLTSVHDYWKNHSLNYMDLCWQSDVSAFKYTFWVCHSFFPKKQAFNSVAQTNTIV